MPMVRAFLLLLLCLMLLGVAALIWPQRDNVEAANVPVVPAQGSLASPASSPSSAASSDWPNLFGPSHDSVSAERTIAPWPETGPREMWRVPCGAGYSAPIIRQGRLVLFHRQGDEEQVDCLDARTAARLWRHAYPTSYQCPVEYSKGPYSTPVASQDRVYAWSAEGTLRCLTLEEGRLVWQRDLAGDYKARPVGFFPVTSSPLLEDDRLILNVGGTETDAGIVAVDAATGDTLWTATSDAASYATPLCATIHGRRHLFVFTADGLVSLDPGTGQVRWSVPFRAKNRDVVNATSPMVWQDLVFVSGYSLGNLCLEVQQDGSYRELWRDRRRNLDSQYNNLICRDGFVYGFSSLDRSLRCLKMCSGDVQWKWSSDIDRGCSLLAGSRLILFGEYGHLGLLDLDPGEPKPVCLTSQSLLGGDRCFSAPALANGLLYVRDEQELACFDLRHRSPE